MYFKQCVLRKNNVVEVAWIPEHFAHKGHILMIKEDDGWEVEFVGKYRMLDEDVSERSQDYKRTRKASDI